MRMGCQGILFHQLLSNLPCKVLIDATLDVDLGKFVELKLRILAQLLALAPKICLFGV